MGDYIVELENICKAFSGVPALKDVSFNLKAGEVHALLGENGAGKSTLVKILSGVYTKDSGNIKVFDENIDTLNPKTASELGIAIIHQELNLCSHLTVAENIFLGKELTKHGLLDKRAANEKARELLQSLNIDINPELPVGDLQVSKQQMVEIAKALSKNARVLIMDEPTSALTATEIEELFKIIRNLKEKGCGIIYISHRLEELQHIVDRVTVLRDGTYVITQNYAETTQQKLISYMVGRDIKEKFPRVECTVGKTVLEVKNLNAGRLVRDVSFELHEGEIVGIAGLMGAGRTETTRALYGIDQKQSGEIILDGKPITINKPVDSIRAGIVLIPEDRKKDGLFTKLSVKSNIGLPNLDMLSDIFGIVSKSKEKEMALKSVDDLKIKLSTVESDAANLSGGNQQKVVVGKWMSRSFRVAIFDEPTRGIDVAAKIEIYNIINKLKQDGVGILFVSSEMPEILGISDRILVMCDGRITGVMSRTEATQETLLDLATRFEKKIA
ncbi:sugar ABC transporter ATP-binding protein [Leadbettera azotonutricia]|uniref:Ribose import ATP-binding protein RbsA n=1 Tax=Leadbettera azotonutricia (strain ATCC BAA-888 / DSM 13862 / ZAS-9) TaxID=545695 RepID=F5YA47_LEAAZ|nr:sugar ABC transporter ATP-binding protein [Leadbettera azotonutricia]AEF80612.1 ribose import ATP-binding protein RbsA [Leadbettera azotonutricia ZAS-9]